MTSDPDQDLTLGQLLTRGIQSSLKVIEADSPNQSAVQVSNRPRGQQYSLHVYVSQLLTRASPSCAPPPALDISPVSTRVGSV